MGALIQFEPACGSVWVHATSAGKPTYSDKLVAVALNYRVGILGLLVTPRLATNPALVTEIRSANQHKHLRLIPGNVDSSMAHSAKQ